AVTRDEVLETIVDRIASTLGASSAGLFLVSDDGGVANLVRQVGYTEEGARRLASVRVAEGSVVPVIDCICKRSPIWIDSQEELIATYPAVADAITPGRLYRIACLPIVVHDQIAGSLALTFDDAPRLDD